MCLDEIGRMEEEGMEDRWKKGKRERSILIIIIKREERRGSEKEREIDKREEGERGKEERRIERRKNK